MALAQSGVGDSQERAVRLHVRHGGVAGIPHRGAQAADELVHDAPDGSLVGHLSLDPFRDELEGVGDFLLKVPIGRSARHGARSEEHTSELQSLMRISYAVFCLKKKN